MSYPVQILPRRRIDEQRWNDAVARSPYAAPYGYTWWLDAVTGRRWAGLVLDDYRVVLPLHLRISAGPLKLIDGAPFTQHAGPFGSLRAQDVEQLLAAIPRSYLLRRLGLYLDPADLSLLFEKSTLHPRYVAQKRTNYELDLSHPYNQVAESYRRRLKAKLKGLPTLSLEEWSIKEYLPFFRTHVGERAGLKPAIYRRQQALLLALEANQSGKIYRFAAPDGTTTAALCLVQHQRRLIYLMAASSPAGLAQDGMPRLLDAIIRRYAGQNYVLDFEGSDRPGIASFFRSFGARPFAYTALRDRWR